MDKLKKPQILAAFILSALIIIMLFLPPFLSVADDGSMFSVIQNSGLYRLWQDSDMQDGSFATLTYGISSYNISFSNTLSFLVSALKFITLPFGIFDVRLLALIYSLMFIFSAYYVIKHSKAEPFFTNYMLVVLIALIFCDVGYITYFNTLYKEGAALSIFLTLCSTMYYISVSKNPKPISFALFGILSALFVAIKTEYAFIGILLIVFAIRLFALKKELVLKIISLISCFLIIISVAFSQNYTSSDERKISLYHSVFLGALYKSSNVSGDLKDLGLSNELAPLANTAYYDKTNIDVKGDFMKKEFFDKISYTQIFKFYVTHPLRFVQMVNLSANNGYFIRMKYLSNYQKQSGKMPSQNAKLFSIYSFLKGRAIPNTLVFTLIALLSYLVIMIKYWSKAENKLLYEFFIIIGFMALISLKTPTFFYGISNIGKNLFLYNVCFDAMVIISAVSGTRALIERRNAIKSKYGIN